MTAAEEALVVAWLAWDRRPGDHWVAGRMEDACAAVADQHGISTTTLRKRLSAVRRDNGTLTPKATYAEMVLALHQVSA